jgi:integrase
LAVELAVRDEVDFENATWTIPRHRMKGRNPHGVYLSRQALDIFVALHTCTAGSKFVLPSRYDAEEPRQPRRALRRVVDNCTTHCKQREAGDDAKE